LRKVIYARTASAAGGRGHLDVPETDDVNNMLRYSVVLGMILLAGTGCNILGNKSFTKDASPVAPSLDSGPYRHFYPLSDALDLEITFENDRAYDAVQLGLYLLSRSEGLEEAVTVEDPVFFPRYFSIINMDIKDGLLFISQREATRFARAAYGQYQGKVSEEIDLKDFREPHILSDVVTGP
jgi:hypothetical protein